MQTLYNILFGAFFVLSAPFYFLKMWRRGNWRPGFGERFGRYRSILKAAVTNRQIVWLHAVSVGEVNLCTQLIRALEPRLPGVTLLVTTTTSTGMGELQKKLPKHILKAYYPIDRKAWVRKAFRLFRPRAVVLVEAEIWPNFLWRAQELGVPVFLANARLSERSFRGYRRLPRLFGPLFAGLAGVGCQNAADADRLKALGCKPEAVHVTGNIKYDAAKIDERRLLDVPRLLEQLGLPPNARLLVGGSTHPGEEGILAEAFARLKARHPDLFLVVAPRHFERSKDAGHDIEAQGVKFIYRSEVTIHTRLAPGRVDCLLVNTTGELKYFYEHALGGVRRQKPRRARRPKPHRTGRHGQTGCVRAEHGEFRGDLPGDGGAAGGPCRSRARRSWSRPWPDSWRIRRARPRWGRAPPGWFGRTWARSTGPSR